MNRIGFRDVRHEDPNGLLVERIRELMTPLALLESKEVDLPEIIRPENIESVADLFARRDDIRDLKLLPIKDVKSHDHYNSLDRMKLLEELKRDIIQDDVLVLADNLYPYALPPGVNQEILWVAHNDITEMHVALFLGKVFTLRGQNLDEVILFERPLGSESKMVRGSFKHMRHVHVWTKVAPSLGDLYDELGDAR